MLDGVRRRAVPILVSLAGAGLVALLVYGVTAQAPDRTLDEAVAHGERPAAPDAHRPLPLLTAGSARTDTADPATTTGSLAEYRGKVVLLNFWASWCVPCQDEAPLLERTQRRLQPHAGTVLGVTYLDDAPDSHTFVRENRLTYPSLRDTTGEFAHAYGTEQLPESFVIDRAGGIVAISRGEVDQAFVNKAVRLAETERASETERA
jgi:cytochrome c biogenesis protein CcmG, thiol:disulfide interchange protein DsbE